MSFNLEAIRPVGDSGKYSPALYSWLHSKCGSRCRQVFQTKNIIDGLEYSNPWRVSEIIIGERYGDGYVGGRKLSCIVGQLYGVKSTRFAYSEAQWELREITDEFWAEYERVGRCVWDSTHSIPMIGDKNRYTVNGNVRTCNWCGEKHRLFVKKRMVIERTETWQKM